MSCFPTWFDNMHSHTQSLARSLALSFSLPLSHIFIVFVPIFNFRLACKLCCAFFLLFFLFRLRQKNCFAIKCGCVCVCVSACSASQRVRVCVCKRVYYFLITANFALCFIISILRLLCLSSAVSRRFSDAARGALWDAAGGRRQRRLRRRRRRQRRKRTIRLNWFTVERKQTDLFILDVHRELRS